MNEIQIKTTEEKNTMQEYDKVLDFEVVKKLVSDGKKIIVDDIEQKELMSNAREIRLQLKTARIDIEKKRKELKENIVLQGKAIDGLANVLKGMIVPVEKHLENQEKFAEIQEEKRLVEIESQRIEELGQYIFDCSLYNLKDMSPEAYTQLLKNSKIAHEAEIEAERKAEEEKEKREQEEREERERIKQENEKLKKEAMEKEQEEKLRTEAEQQKLDEERQKREEAEKRERELLEEKNKKEQEEKQKIKQEEEKKIREKETLNKASDKEKIEMLSKTIFDIKTPAVKSESAKKIVLEVQNALIELSASLKKYLNK